MGRRQSFFSVKKKEKKQQMAAELYPSSFRCDCGKELDFFENTIRDMKKMSKKNRVRLGEDKHTIVFYNPHSGKIFAKRLFLGAFR